MIEPTDKLYVLVRRDLSHGYQVAQAIHGRDEFSEAHPDIAKDWRQRSNTVVALHVEDVTHLRTFHMKATTQGIPCAVFYEPDLGGEPTCLVLGPTGRRLARSLPLVS